MEEIDFKWPNGFFADGIHAGLRKKRLDMGWVVSEVPAQSAGVYTTNQFQAAPTKLTKETINKKHELQAIIMNSAVANSARESKERKMRMRNRLSSLQSLELIKTWSVLPQPA